MTATDPSVWMSLKSPRLIKSHSQYFYPFRRVIYLVRDGRHATASNYRFVKNRYHYQKSFSEYISNKNQDQWPGTWAFHVKSWLDHPNQHFLMIRYEDLRYSPLQEVKKMVHFLDWDISDQRIQAAIDCSSIDQMKKNEKKVNLNLIGNGHIVNPWKDYSNEEKELFLTYSLTMFEDLGYLKTETMKTADD